VLTVDKSWYNRLTMNTLRKLRSPWAIVTVLLATYVGSYFGVSYYCCGAEMSGRPNALWGLRVFKNQWMADFYRPVIIVEFKVRRRRPATSYVDPEAFNIYRCPPPKPAIKPGPRHRR